MGNALPSKITRGTIGELLAQIYLLVYGVQAAPPIRDTGNDLIACKGEVFLAIQVKTRLRHCFPLQNMPKIYHALVFIVLEQEGEKIHIEKPDIYLMSREEAEKMRGFRKKALEPYKISQKRVDDVFVWQNAGLGKFKAVLEKPIESALPLPSSE